MKRKVVIFGISKVAQIVYAEINEDEHSNLEVIGFCVDAEFYQDEEMFGKPIVKFEEVENYFPPSEYQMLIAIGYHKMNKIRTDKCQTAKSKGYSLVSFIHSKADISKTVEIGENCIILNNVSIEPFAKIGNNVCVFCNATISHHTEVRDNLWITSGTVIGGNAIIGSNCFLGINSTIGHNIQIGNNNFIGANAVITKNTEDNSVYAVPDTPKYRLNTDQFMRMFNFD